MAFNFDDLLKQGKGAAEDVIQNRKEVKDVLHDLELSLSKFLEIEVKLKEYIEYVEADYDPMAALAQRFKPKEKTGFDVVKIVSEQVEISKEVFKLKRSDDIYPIKVVRDRNHSIADDQKEFASAIGEIASNSQFHLQLNSFKKEVEEKLQEKPRNVPRSE
ncbi:hypothetical protein [Saccharospirillum alexandrii]|uniref:hypothetical protein n=1 Tax=Saccharospirillum alexandrii TaxID=2448477 RepID=UPI003734D162